MRLCVRQNLAPILIILVTWVTPSQGARCSEVTVSGAAVKRAMKAELRPRELACVSAAIPDFSSFLDVHPYEVIDCLGFSRFKELCERFRAKGIRTTPWDQTAGQEHTFETSEEIREMVSAGLRRKVLRYPVRELNLSRRMEGALSRLGIETIGELLDLTEAQLLRRANVAKGTLSDLRYKLKRAGLSLRG